MPLGYRSVLRHGRVRNLPTKAGFSRREVLKLGAMGAVSTLLASAIGPTSLFAQEAPQVAGLRVAIIGGGFGGLACAYTLQQAGAAVTVFEAQPRVGGRVVSNHTFIEGQTIEYGGEFIGSNHPTWIELADTFNLERTEINDYEGEDGIILEGKLIRGEAADALYEEVDETLALLIAMARGVDPQRPWEALDAAELDKQNVGDWIDAQAISDQAKRLMHTLEAADNGVPTSQMSLLGYLAVIAGGGFEAYYEESETHRLEGGNEKLAIALAQALGDAVKMGTPVASVHRSADKVTITTDSGETAEADVVVLAAAPSVWHKIDFTPPPPEELMPQMGKNTKLILAVNKPVWEDNGLNPELVTDGPVSLTWLSADGDETKDHSLTLFSGAEAAEALRNRNSARRTTVSVESIKEAYPGLADAITKDVFLDWPGHPQVGASYSFPAPGQVTAHGPVWASGLTDMAPMYFAGEHTSYAFIGYMEGALSSGVRAAQQVMEHAKQAG